MLGHRALTVEDYLRILRKRGWIVAIPAIVLPLIAVGITFLIPAQYISQTLVLVEQQKVPDDDVKPVISEDLNGRLASMKEQIMSRLSLQPIIERFNLYGTTKMTMDDRIDQTRKSIDIKPIHSEIARTGGLPGFFISFKAGDARTAQAVCGEITSLFVSQNLRDREQSVQGTTAFLRQQLADAKRNLDDQDSKLAKFQQTYVGRLPGQEDSNMNMLTSLNTQLDAATQALNRMEQDKSYEEALLAQQTRDLQVPEQSPTQRALAPAQNTELIQLQAQEAELSARYTPDYPDVVAVRRKIRELQSQAAKAPAPVASSSPTYSAPRNEPASVQQLRAQLRALDQGIASKRAPRLQREPQPGDRRNRQAGRFGGLHRVPAAGAAPARREAVRRLTTGDRRRREHQHDDEHERTETEHGPVEVLNLPGAWSSTERTWARTACAERGRPLPRPRAAHRPRSIRSLRAGRRSRSSTGRPQEHAALQSRRCPAAASA